MRNSTARIAAAVLLAAAAVGTWALTRAPHVDGGAPPRDTDPGASSPAQGTTDAPAPLRGRQPGSAPSGRRAGAPPGGRARDHSRVAVRTPAAGRPPEPGSPEALVFEALGREQPEASEIVQEWIVRRQEFEEELSNLIREGEAARGALEDYDRRTKERYDHLVELVGQQAADRIVEKVVVYRIDPEHLRLARIGPGGRLVPVER